MIKQLENRISSREVADMMEIEHPNLLKKIDKINEDFVKVKINFYKYWNESEYINPVNNKPCREFQISKKGCEFLAHKTTGTKGNLFTHKYMQKFEAMEQFIENPNGVIKQLTNQIASMNLELQEIKGMLNKRERQRLASKKHQLKIKPPLEKRLENITDEMINQILVNSLATGLLRVTDEGNVVDKEVLFNEANKLNISKHDIKIKLELLNKIIYKQVRINGKNMWCIVINR
ncbi:Rha family transcriptional regulator [Clostridium neonatale]|uniref:Rha family transcriptional regulator n=1 Tax=Clostridium neonatale TaxID=137838 RepID=UPI001DEB8E63|nr:Rha family transcriptional regulator [Clostridium neonatale]CAG9706447.1 Putative phage regulatory protein [Clostridium neonatale]